MAETLQKTVLVTGASRGIGKAIASAFAGGGFRLLTCSTGRLDPSQNIASDHHYAVDFSDRAAVDDFADEIEDAKIDVLVNNAGINKIAPFAEIDPDDFLRIHLVNVYAPFRLCQAVLPHMETQEWGRIVNLSSIWGMRSKEFRASYSASKFGLDGMTAALAMEHGKNGILANAVSPGFIDTELTRSILSPGQIADLTSLVACRRLGSVEEVAKLILWLGSESNTFVTGQNIPIDGGYTRA